MLHSKVRARVRANIVAPDSSTLRSVDGPPRVDRAGAYAGTARPPGTAWEVAAPVVFLLSDDASYITGQLLAVDGGLSSLELVYAVRRADPARPSDPAGFDRDQSIAFHTSVLGCTYEGQREPFSVIRVTPELTLQLDRGGRTVACTSRSALAAVRSSTRRSNA